MSSSSGPRSRARPRETALALSTAESVRPAVQQAAQFQDLNHTVEIDEATGTAAPSVAQVLGHAEVGKKKVILEDHANVPLFGRKTDAGGGIQKDQAAQVDGACKRSQETADQAQHGGLAAAGGPEEGGHPIAHLKRDTPG